MKKSRVVILQIAFILLVSTQTYAQICYTCPGNNNNVTGTAASAFGNNNFVSGAYSNALGSGNRITSNYSFIAGNFDTIQSFHSYVIGSSSKVGIASTESYVIGTGSVAGNTKVMMIGHRLQSGAGSQIILGSGPIGGGYLSSNKMYSLAVGFKSTVPTFFVGESPSSIRTGKVSIGNTTDPQAKLHIRADAAEDASLLLEATGTNKISSFIMAGGQAYLGTASNNHSLSFVTGGTNTRMFINAANGNIAIGNNTDPQARLHIKAEGTQDAGILLEASGTGKSAGIFFTKSAVNIGTLDKDQPIAFFTAGTDLKMKITPEGNVGIGVASPLYKLHVAGNAKFDNQVVIDAGGLYVNGEVKAKKFHASISPFPDFVFEPGYKLLSINEVESFINQNGHLPGVPNAVEVEQNGIELGEMNALLLQKIEELTLYIIAQDKEMKELKAIVETLK